MSRLAAACRSERRAKREARELEESLSRLTLRGRLAVVLSELSMADLRAVRDGLLAKAQAGEEKAVHALARLLDQSSPSARLSPRPSPRPVVGTRSGRL
jgi:hypothetical protein